MINNIIENKKSYTEVYKILSNLSEKERQKIPKSLIQNIRENMDINYDFKFNINKPLQYQNISEKSKLMLSIIFRDYLATENQRNKIINFEKSKRKELDEKARQKYNIDVFQEKRNQNIVNKEIDIHTEIANITWYTKLTNLFRNVFNKIFKKEQ